MTITEGAFIISDTHFGHLNMITYEPSRESLAVRNSDEAASGLSDRIYHKLADAWNEVIGKDDTVLHL